MFNAMAKSYPRVILAIMDYRRDRCHRKIWKWRVIVHDLSYDKSKGRSCKLFVRSLSSFIDFSCFLFFFLSFFHRSWRKWIATISKDFFPIISHKIRKKAKGNNFLMNFSITKLLASINASKKKVIRSIFITIGIKNTGLIPFLHLRRWRKDSSSNPRPSPNFSKLDETSLFIEMQIVYLHKTREENKEAGGTIPNSGIGSSNLQRFPSINNSNHYRAIWHAEWWMRGRTFGGPSHLCRVRDEGWNARPKARPSSSFSSHRVRT